MHIRRKREKEVLNCIIIYNDAQVKDIREKIAKTIIDLENESIIIGDFNIRIRELGKEEGRKTRNSKDKTIDEDGKRLIEQLIEKGLSILNGKRQKD